MVNFEGAALCPLPEFTLADLTSFATSIFCHRTCIHAGTTWRACTYQRRTNNPKLHACITAGAHALCGRIHKSTVLHCHRILLTRIPFLGRRQVLRGKDGHWLYTLKLPRNG
jgi:hypothetical protein